MKPIDDPRWLRAIETIDFAFQPIVNIHTGACYGYEALLRNHMEATTILGVEASIGAIFDSAYLSGVLHQVDLALREKAVKKFAKIGWHRRMKLFFNLDNRVLSSSDYQTGRTSAILKRHGLSPDNLCFEISERHQLAPTRTPYTILENCRSQGYRIAVDDCGAGFSGFQMLYHTEPHYIKIDRFFISDITGDPKKKLLVASLVRIAHLMGSIVIAEGVETVEEFHSCRDIGCDLVQGYLVQFPETNLAMLKRDYRHIEALSRDEKRDGGDRKLIASEMDATAPLRNDCDILTVFGKFKAKDASFFPIIDINGEPLGVIREDSLKAYAYSRFGIDLLQNPAFGKQLAEFISQYPIADINSSIEEVLAIYTANSHLEGIIIVDRMKYKGFLSAKSLLRVLNEKNLTIARDQNPLTKLAGNTLIYEFISDALAQTDADFTLVYFDFDNFKPFNDRYGFRNGDRLLLLFSDLLKRSTAAPGHFSGHIGGDDFFMGVRGQAADTILCQVRELAEAFRVDAETFYDKEAVEKGCITGKDREGKYRSFPLITVSSVILTLPSGRVRTFTTEEVSCLLGPLKSAAKRSFQKLAVGGVNPQTGTLEAFDRQQAVELAG